MPAEIYAPTATREQLLAAAEDMIEKGWQPVWCLARQSGSFTPIPGTTGGSAPYPSVESQPAGAHRLAFRPPPSVVLLDVDDYTYAGHEKHGALTLDAAEEWLGDLPETWRVTSRGWDNPSGRYLFRKPEDLDFTDSALYQFAWDDERTTDIEIVRTSHRFSWAPGDTHYKNGELIQCFDPDGEICWLPYVHELPELPERWVRYLRNPPVAQSAEVYTRPSDGPEWWLSQADHSLGSRAELARFGFYLMASRLSEDQAMAQLRRVALAVNPSDPWEDEHLWGLVDANTQRKTAELVERQEAEYDSLPATGPELDRIARTAYEDYSKEQQFIARLEPQAPLNEEVGKKAMEQLRDADSVSNSPARQRASDIRNTPGYVPVLNNELFRIQARKDAAWLLSEDFKGFESIAYLPAPSPPSTLFVVGSDKNPGCHIIPEKKVLVLSGARSSGKTWITATWAVQEMTPGNTVIWIDFERQKEALNERLMLAGAQPHIIDRYLQYTAEPPPVEALVNAIREASEYGLRRVLLVVDAFRGLQGKIAPGTSAIDGDAVEAVYLEYLNPAIEAGATVCLLDHLPKAGGATFGSERKESAADYVITVEQVEAFTKEKPGYSTMTLTKDRYGYFAADTKVGHLWMPGDGSQSAAEGITKYPGIPTLRNWAPDTEASLSDLPDSSGKGKQELILIELVAANPLKYSINKLAKDAMDGYPELFKAESTTKARIRALVSGGKLAKEEGSNGHLDTPAPVAGNKAASLDVPALDPKLLEHEYEGENTE